MDRLFMLFGDFGDVRSGGGDTWIDRLNCRYTVYVLVFFSLLVTTRHFVDEPIACWGESHFTSSQVEFVNKVGLLYCNELYYLKGENNQYQKNNCMSRVVVNVALCCTFGACLLPKKFLVCFHQAVTENKRRFYLQVCWTKDTYYLDVKEKYIPKKDELKEYLSYYQWIGLILVLQAIFFYLPSPLWRILGKQSGIAVSTITGE